MATAEKLPFSWRDVEGLADLARLGLVLETLPDGEIVAALEAARGRGRNDYPVRAMWRALIAGVVFQHGSVQSLLRELGRNPALLEICGFDPLPYQGAPVTELRDGHAVTRPARVRSTVPSHWNFSRFLGSVVRLEDERGLVSDMIGSLRTALEDWLGAGAGIGALDGSKSPEAIAAVSLTLSSPLGTRIGSSLKASCWRW